MKRLLHPVHAVMDRLGRRGTVLAIFSVVFLFTGLKAILDPSMDEGRFMLYAHLPIWSRVLLWCIPSILGLVAAVQKERHNDAYGFAALTIPAVVLIVSYAVSWIAYLVGVTNYGNAWVSALQWVLILVLLLVTSGWTEVKRHVIYDPEKGGDDS